MNYTDEDYARLYNTMAPKPRALSLREFLLLALAAVVLGMLIGCDDGRAAEVTAKRIEEAKATPPALSYPCIATMRLETLSGRVVHEGCYSPKDAR